jgi:hypothetical protein
VILVRVRQQGEVDAAVPGWEALVEAADEEVRVGPAVHEEPGAGDPFKQDGVSLPDVEHRHAQALRGPCDDDDDRQARDEGRHAHRHPPAPRRRLRGTPLALRPAAAGVRCGTCLGGVRTAARAPERREQGHGRGGGRPERDRFRELDAGEGQRREDVRHPDHDRQR